jgi:hypothetical protein
LCAQVSISNLPDGISWYGRTARIDGNGKCGRDYWWRSDGPLAYHFLGVCYERGDRNLWVLVFHWSGGPIHLQSQRQAPREKQYSHRLRTSYRNAPSHSCGVLHWSIFQLDASSHHFKYHTNGDPCSFDHLVANLRDQNFSTGIFG